jgi:hypothetical protein
MVLILISIELLVCGIKEKAITDLKTIKETE